MRAVVGWACVIMLASLASRATGATIWEDIATGGTLGCKAWSAHESRLNRKSGFACLSVTTGALTGALTNRSGRVACIFQGYDDGACLHVSGCRMDQVTCR